MPKAAKATKKKAEEPKAAPKAAKKKAEEPQAAQGNQEEGRGAAGSAQGNQEEGRQEGLEGFEGKAWDRKSILTDSGWE